MFDLYEEVVACCPCLVFAHSDPGFAAAAGRALRRRGWDVYAARHGPEARRLARMIGADLVLLDTELPGESGWLTCAKLAGELPLVPVILVAADPDDRSRRFASFVGASNLLGRDAGLASLVWEVDEAAATAVAG
jgi:DNA-binding response OmpR family regulator